MSNAKGSSDLDGDESLQKSLSRSSEHILLQKLPAILPSLEILVSSGAFVGSALCDFVGPATLLSAVISSLIGLLIDSPCCALAVFAERAGPKGVPVFTASTYVRGGNIASCTGCVDIAIRIKEYVVRGVSVGIIVALLQHLSIDSEGSQDG